MSEAITSVALSLGEYALLVDAADTGRISVRGAGKRAARSLAEKQLGVLSTAAGESWFEINPAGRDQLRIRG